VIVDVEGTGPQAQFTFKGVAKPGSVPDAPPVVTESKAAGGGAGRAPDQRRVAPRPGSG
jgi:hypothetical protein